MCLTGKKKILSLVSLRLAVGVSLFNTSGCDNFTTGLTTDILRDKSPQILTEYTEYE